MKLAIISHTEHYTTADGRIVGWGPTVNEINHLLEVFDEIWHVAMWHEGMPPKSALPYDSPKIHFVAIPTVGGSGIGAKLGVLWQAPRTLGSIQRVLKDVDCFQFRAPTGIGVFVIPYLLWFASKPGWFKYAGNWNQAQPPLAYQWQRWLLQQQSRTVTINGHWPQQPVHCLNFENPCLTEREIAEGEMVMQLKSKSSEGVHFCFVGRLEAEKGIGLLLEAFALLSAEELSQIAKIHVVGTGKQRAFYEAKAKESGLPFVFYGHLSRTEVHAIYHRAHAIVLPSASEGFPKVIAEAMNYACLPIVSDVSAISQYVRHGQNGFLLVSLDTESVVASIRRLLFLTNEAYNEMVAHARSGIERFGYKYYNTRLKEVLATSESEEKGDG